MSTTNVSKTPPAPKPPRSAKAKRAHKELAPDSLPWPKGYFDRTPRQTLEEAISIHGVRPSQYRFGWPVYTLEDMALPGFKSLPPPEPPKLERQWRKECDEWDANQKKSSGAHVK
jgi:hypothetical protein